MKNFIFTILFSLLVLGCKYNSGKDTYEIDGLSEAQEVTKNSEEIASVFNRLTKVNELRYEIEKDSLIYPKISLPPNWDYELISGSDTTYYDGNYEYDYFEIGDFKIRDDSLMYIELSNSLIDNSGDSYIRIIPSLDDKAINFNAYKTESIEDEVRYKIVYEDDNSVIYEHGIDDFLVEYLDYNNDKKCFIYGLSNLDLFNTPRNVAFEQALLTLRDFKNLQIPAEEVNQKIGTPTTWEEFHEVLTLSELNELKLGFKNLDKEMKHFLDENEKFHLLENDYSKNLSIYRATTEKIKVFDVFILALENNLINLDIDSSVDFNEELIRWIDYMEDNLFEDTSSYSLNYLDDNVYLIQSAFEPSKNQDFDDYLIYKIEKYGKTFFVQGTISKKEDNVTLYKTAIDYYLKHKTLDIE